MTLFPWILDTGLTVIFRMQDFIDIMLYRIFECRGVFFNQLRIRTQRIS